MSDKTSTTVSYLEHRDFVLQDPKPGILVAHTPTDSYGDRCLIDTKFIFGRAANCTLLTTDSKVSGQHFCISHRENRYWLEDLNSSNGTFIRGIRVKGRVSLAEQTVIRAGRVILVFLPDATQFLTPEPVNAFGIAGRFYPGRLLKELREAAVSARNVLFSGESGCGKELATHAFASYLSKENTPCRVLIYNAARFASREEATSTLFGVAPRFFSNVDAREGLVEKAHGGVLFIDELHNLPEEAQRTLLRIIETGETARLGETDTRKVNVRFVIASNAQGSTCGLAHDLYARLRHVPLIPINERIADVPAIFDAVLGHILAERGIAAEVMLSAISANHYEALCLEDYTNRNVRVLVDLADRLVTRILTQDNASDAVVSVFGERYGQSVVALRQRKTTTSSNAAVSHYEHNKELIIKTFRTCENNLTETERVLKKKGLKCSRRWLAVFLEEWKERVLRASNSNETGARKGDGDNIKTS